MIDTVKIWTGWLATGVEAAAALVIAVAVLRALVGAGRLLLAPGGQNDAFSEGVAAAGPLAGGGAGIRAGRRHPAHGSRAELGRDRQAGRHRHAQNVAQLLSSA